jgi:hypothetical protein
VHNKGDRTCALTLSAFGVLEGEEVRDGDGVCRLLIEDMKAERMRPETSKEPGNTGTRVRLDNP